MIIKLNTTEVDKDGANKSWVYFDGFRKVKSILLKKFDGVDHYDCDYVIVDYEQVKKFKQGYLIICSLEYSKEISGRQEYRILTNQTTYLLNDEGKTIERLS